MGLSLPLDFVVRHVMQCGMCLNDVSPVIIVYYTTFSFPVSHPAFTMSPFVNYTRPSTILSVRRYRTRFYWIFKGLTCQIHFYVLRQPRFNQGESGVRHESARLFLSNSRKSSLRPRVSSSEAGNLIEPPPRFHAFRWRVKLVRACIFYNKPTNLEVVGQLTPR
jgi:hypothetical protein